MPSMRCSSCGEPLVTPLERTRGFCASCHVLSPRPSKKRASEQNATFPASRSSLGDNLDGTIAPPTPLSHQSPAQDDVSARDSNGSNTSEETGLSR